MADITYCSASEQSCSMTPYCRRAEWRRGDVDSIHQSYADFSEELIRVGQETGVVTVSCQFFLYEKSQ